MVLGFVSRLCEGVARRASCEQTASGWSVGCACHHPNICADPGRSMGCAFRHPALNHAWCSCGLQGTSSTSNVLILESSCWKQLAHSRHVMTLVMVLSAGLDGSRPYDFRLCKSISSRSSCKRTASGWSMGCACHHPIVCTFCCQLSVQLYQVSFRWFFFRPCDFSLCEGIARRASL